MARKLKPSGSTKAVLRKNNPPQGSKPRHWKQVWPYLKYGSINPIWQDREAAKQAQTVQADAFSNPISI